MHHTKNGVKKKIVCLGHGATNETVVARSAPNRMCEFVRERAGAYRVSRLLDETPHAQFAPKLDSRVC